MNIFKNINITSIANNTSSILNIIKKTIPIYREIKPLIKNKKNTNFFDANINENKKESNSEYNDSLTFFQ